MKTSKISAFIDYIFYFMSLFLCSVVWARFFIHNTALIISISIIISTSILVVIYLINKKKKAKIKLSQSQKEYADNFSTQLSFFTQKEQCKELCKIFNINMSNIKKNCIIYKQFALVPLFQYKITSYDSIIQNFANIKNLGLENIVFVANDFSLDAKNFKNVISSTKVVLLDKYQFVKIIGFDYKITLMQGVKKTKKEKFVDLLNLAFNKSKSKNYFIYGILLFICSLFFRYNVYYIVFSSLMFCFSIFSRFNKKFNTTKKQDYSFLTQNIKN